MTAQRVDEVDQLLTAPQIIIVDTPTHPATHGVEILKIFLKILKIF